MSTLVLIDGNSLMHRAYHALPSLKTATGQATGAVYGFSSMLIKILKELEPTHMAVAFDTKEPTFRHEEFPDYKAQRPEMEEELRSQVDLVKDVVDAFGIERFEVEGYEADDVVATMVSKAHNSDLSEGKEDLEVIVVTGDLDLLQLVSEHVCVYMPKRGLSDTAIYDEKAVEKRFGLHPEKLDDFKALVGDSSDNIPGIKGIGKKTAAQILSQYENLKDVYNHLGDLPDKWVKKLSGRREEALKWRDLVVVRRSVPINFQSERLRLNDESWGEVAALFERLGFKTLLKRLGSVRSQKQGSLFES